MIFTEQEKLICMVLLTIGLFGPVFPRTLDKVLRHEFPEALRR